MNIETDKLSKHDLRRIEQQAKAEEESLEEYGTRRHPRRTFTQRLAEGFGMLDSDD